ncbi:MAG: hypothetical protein H7A25_08125 [Leptospiraceae bacterium]|nr:hypothetical protein [Leptospiraceae bacterium]
MENENNPQIKDETSRKGFFQTLVMFVALGVSYGTLGKFALNFQQFPL